MIVCFTILVENMLLSRYSFITNQLSRLLEPCGWARSGEWVLNKVEKAAGLFV